MNRILSPYHGISAKRYLALESYVAASHTRRSMKGWNPVEGDADSHALYELPDIRKRSHDACRNSPLGLGAINTYVTSVIGGGLRCFPHIDAELLGMNEAEAEAWEVHAAREFSLFAEGPEIDIARTHNLFGIQDVSLRSMLAGGDIFHLFPRKKRAGSPYKTKIQMIEAERVCNENDAPDSDRLAGGIERDEDNAPFKYHILHGNPHSLHRTESREWSKVRAFGEKTGRRNVTHGFFPTRPNQSRGIPYLAPVLEPLRQLGMYTDSELMAAVVSSMFTVFVKSEMGDDLLSDMQGIAGAGESSTPDADYKLGNGAIVGLANGEEIQTANPGRPNAQFDPFFLAILRQIGACLEIPFEIIIKYFQASYSAARGAMMMAWKFFMARRTMLISMICQPIYEAFMWEAVAESRIHAPGFFSDPLVRMAYLGSEWIGPPKGQIDELKEGKAQQLYEEMGVKTLETITHEVTGGSWRRNHRQSVKERKARQDARLIQTSQPARIEGPQEVELQES